MKPQQVLFEPKHHGVSLQFAGYTYRFSGVIVTDFGVRYCYVLA